MKKHSISRFIPAAVFLIAAGCALPSLLGGCATPAPEVKSDVKDPVPGERKIGEAMLKAYEKNDAKAFLKYLSKDAREKFGEKEFRVTREQITEAMGKVASTEFLTTLYAPGFRSHLWKVRFERTEVMNPRKKLTQETLFRIVIVTPENGGEPYIFTFGFL